MGTDRAATPRGWSLAVDARRPVRVIVLGAVLAVLLAVLAVVVASPPQRAAAAVTFGPGGVTVSGVGIGELVVVVGDSAHAFEVDGTYARLVPAVLGDNVSVLLDGELLAGG